MSVNGIVKKRWTAAALWGLLSMAAAYLFLFEPGHTGFFPACPIRALTGFSCPGCGTTRALHQLLHGNLLAAFELNPLLTLFLPLLGCLLLLYTRSAITGKAMPQVIVPRKCIWAFWVLVIVFSIFRNTAVYPFPS